MHGSLGKLFRRKHAVLVTTTEVARADLPDQIAATLQVIRAKPTLTRVVSEATKLGSATEGQNRIHAERAETHRRNIQQAARVRLPAVGSTNGDSHIAGVDFLGLQRVIHPFITRSVHIDLGAKRSRVARTLRSLIDQRTMLPIEGHPFVIALDEVLTNLWPNELQQITHATQHRKVPTNRLLLLGHVPQTQHNDRPQQDPRP